MKMRFQRNPYLEGSVIKAFNEGLTSTEISEKLGISKGHYHNIAATLRKEGKMGYRLRPHQIQAVMKNIGQTRAVPITAASQAVSIPVTTIPSGTEHRLRLRNDFDLVVRVPDDLTHDEVDRIGYWFRAIVR